MWMTNQPFVQAEIDYRLERARKQYPRPIDGEEGYRVPRRRPLRLRHPRLRPLRLA